MLRTELETRKRWTAALAADRPWAIATAVAAGALYLLTLQTNVNGVVHPYTTDVGEIQNALPRWGTIHYPGYPLYSLLGSLFVTALRLVGVAPAAGSSLYSAVWGVLTVYLLYVLSREMGAGPVWAALGSLVAALSTSQWMDASLAEIHTMGTVLLIGVLLFALRFRHHGRQRDLRALALTFSLGLMHQRTLLFLAPAVLLLIWPRRPELRSGLPIALALATLGPLTYLYLPVRAWQGADWTFGAVGTWQGFLQIFLDTKVDRVVAVPQDLGSWLVRVKTLLSLLHDDLWLPVLGVGLVGLWFVPRRRGGWQRPLALTLAWLPTVPLSLLIWEGGVSDALLAAKLPLVLLAGVGLALAAQTASELGPRGGVVATCILLVVAGAEIRLHRPAVLAITRDDSAERTIAIAEQVAQPQGGPPTTFLALWGNSYWPLAYAQAYGGQLSGLTLIDHNADVGGIARRERLLTFCDTLYHRPLSWWDERLNRAYLSSPAPEIIAVSTEPAGSESVPSGATLDLQNGAQIASARLQRQSDASWILTVYWQAYRQMDTDYHVAVHLLSKVPPQEPSDIVAQADRLHPVCGWYPTTRWEPGEVVMDSYLLSAPQGSEPVAIRVGMYETLPGGGFSNSPWLTLALE